MIVCATWYTLSEVVVRKRNLLPSPHEVLYALLELLADGSFFQHAWASTYRVVVGFLLAVVMAIPAGFAMGWYRVARGLFEPIVQVLRTIPPIAIIPLVIIGLGIDDEAKIFIIWLSAFLTLVIAVYQGVRNIDPTLIKAARVLGAKDSSLFFDIIVPASIPYTLVGMRLALAASWTTLVAAELVASNYGLGFLINDARKYSRVDVVLVGILTIGVLGITMDRLVLLLERRLTSWQERVQR